jgi:GNAT superfamily N-acetyltransferase
MDIIKVRVAKPSDKSAIVDFQLKMAQETEEQVLDKDTISKGVKAVIDDPSKATYFVAEVDGNKGIVGSLMITDEWSDWRNGWVWWIQSLYVIPEFRKKGVFSALFEHINSLIQASTDVKGLRLYVDKRNKKAQNIYDAIGMSGDHYITYELMK